MCQHTHSIVLEGWGGGVCEEDYAYCQIDNDENGAAKQ